MVFWGAKTPKSLKKIPELFSLTMDLFCLKKNCDESAQTDALKKILPPNSIQSRFSELDVSHWNDL